MPECTISCDLCGRVQEVASGACLVCGGSLSMTIVPDGLEILTEQGPPALHGAARRVGGSEEVVFRSFGGSQATSRLDSETVMVQVLAPVEVGQRGELAVAQILAATLSTSGRDVGSPEKGGNRDDDMILPVAGSYVPVQVVTIPRAPEFWRDVAHGSGLTIVSIGQAAGWVHDALMEKSKKYPPALKHSMILAVDCRFAGAAVSLPVKQSYIAQFGDPVATLGFGAIWLVGGHESRCTQLGQGRW